jgi:hypothetical protein
MSHPAKRPTPAAKSEMSPVYALLSSHRLTPLTVAAVLCHLAEMSDRQDMTKYSFSSMTSENARDIFGLNEQLTHRTIDAKTFAQEINDIGDSQKMLQSGRQQID